MMLPSLCKRIWICTVLAASSIGLGTMVRAADDTARFNGAWKTNFPYNGRTVTLVSVHDGSKFRNYLLLPQRSMPVGDGTLAAVDGKWTITAATTGNDSGTYEFTDDNTAVCKNAAGVTVVWQRNTAPLPPVIGAAPVPPVPASEVTPELRSDILAKMKSGDDQGALNLDAHRAAVSPDPFLCTTHARVMLRLENYRQARYEVTCLLQRTFDYPDAYVVHAQASAAMGDVRWADRDLAVAAQIDDANRVDKALWAKNVPTAMLAVTSVQGTSAPHLAPVKAAPLYDTLVWALQLHKAGRQCPKGNGAVGPGIAGIRRRE